jgi:uncharacterized protein YndB with AHSA1/START domain
MNQTSAATQSLVMRRTFKASRERVFAAWTQPEILREWFAPPPGWTVPDAALDLRVGGAYRIAFRSPEGEISEVSGHIRELQAPERLAYTWTFAGFPADTLVTIEFYDRGEETELVLTHEHFADDAMRDRHEGGWTMSLGNLARTLANC